METTNQNKPTLQIVKEELETELTLAIEAAIKRNKSIERCSTGATIEGVYVIKRDASLRSKHAVVLNIASPVLDALFEPTSEQLAKRAENLRAELKEIENKLKGGEQ